MKQFFYSQDSISQLKSGDTLAFDEECCRNLRGQPVVRFSKQLISKINVMKQKNYMPQTARVRFIVYWKKENSEREIKIVLPELYFKRVDNTCN
jgi:ATP-dependent DNA helicase RecQ